MSRLLHGAAVAALALAACAAAGAAHAQSYGRLVVFGDSLSDNGNLFAATGGAQPPAPFYSQGRFSTGPVFTERLGFNAGRLTAGAPVSGSINLAFGGARTDASATPLGMRTQLATYRGAGGTFGAGDLVSVLGGANNIFQGLSAFGALPPGSPASQSPTGYMAPIATSAAVDINAIVDGIAAAGAGTILVTNLPKLSLTPQFRNTAAAPLADFAVTTFNTRLATDLAGTAAARAGANIIQMDLFKIGDTIAGNPALFGVSNVTEACFNQAALTMCANPAGYFYLDGVHPTATGHQVIADLATDYLYYADRGAGAALLGETGWRHREEALAMATDGLSGRAGWEAGASLSVTGLYDQVEFDARGPVAAGESKGHGVRIAFDAAPSERWRFGLAGTFRDTEIDAGAVEASAESIGADVYVGWRSGSAFVNVAGGLSRDHYDYQRATALRPITHIGASDGVSVGARAQAGVWLDMGAVALSPRVAVTWVSTEVDAFTEEGPAAQYRYLDRNLDGVTAEAALRAEADLGGWSLFAEGGYSDSLDDGGDPVRVGIGGNTARVLSRNVAEPFGGRILAGAGIEGAVGPVRVSLGYRGRFGDHADSHMGALTLSLPL